MDSIIDTQLLLDISSDGLCVLNRLGKIVDANQQCSCLLGYTAEELLAMTMQDIDLVLKKADLGEKVKANFLKSEYRTVLKHKNGKRISVNVRVFFDAKKSSNFFVALRDIQLEVNAKTRTNIIDKIFNNSTEAIIVTDRRGNILLTNTAFSTITGYSFLDVKNKTPAILKSGRHDAQFYKSFWSQLKAKGFWSGEIWNKRKNGEIYPEWLNITSINNEKGNVTNFVAQFSDISSIKKSESMQAFHAYHDPLTRLPNRRLLFERLEHLQNNRTEDSKKFIVLFCDLDRFKSINDSLGHNVGDEVLRVISNKLQGCMRTNDTVARSGGDEFIIIIEGVDSVSGIERIAGKLVKLFDKPVKTKYGEFFVSASIGVSRYPYDSTDINELISFADIAMYQVKSVGGNNYCVFDSKQKQNVLHRIELETYIFNALKNDEFELWYQPQINSASNDVYGIECLLRWRHPKYGLISPDLFIPIAEKNGLITAIGEFVLKTAFKQSKEWRDSKVFSGIVAINISFRQFEKNDLAQQVSQLLSNEKLPANTIELEVTESIFVEDDQFHIDTLEKLRQLGVKIAIDDFGTGYSSLVRLKQLPIDNLKIDKCFVDKIIYSDKDLSIVNALCLLSRSFGIDVIAEGVELQEQASVLNKLGCYNHQGYLYGKPMPAEQFEEWIENFQITNKGVKEVS